MDSKLRFWIDPKLKAENINFASPRVGDAGYDLRASEDIVIEAGKQALVPTGLKFSIPLGWVGIIKDRSSMAVKRVYSHAGVIDASYRGEVKIVLSNGSNENYSIKKGDKVAQMIVVQHLTDSEEVLAEEELGITERSAGGFGSTGRT